MNENNEFDSGAASAEVSNPVPAIDLDELLQRCLGNVALAERVLGRFSSEFSDKLADLRRLASAGDENEIRRVTHQLKGTAANIAAHRLQSCLAAVHESSEQRSWDQVNSLLDHLEQEFEQFEAARPTLSATTVPESRDSQPGH